MPRRPTPWALTPKARRLSAGVQAAFCRTRLRGSTLLPVGALTAALLAGGAALAGPAAAAEDPTAPQATVTRGPSCDPGGMEISVTAGTAAFDVVLASTRDPDGEDRAQLQPGASVLLHTGPVDWGETVDPRLEYTALDGAGTSFVDELDDWTMTRPTEQDCATVSAPAAVPTASAPTTSAPAPDPDTPSGTPAPSPGAPVITSPPAPAPDAPDPCPPTGPSAVVASGAAGADVAASRAVGAGRPITVRATGFQPGEEVTVRLDGGAAPLGRATAGPDGTVEVPIFVPADSSGPTRLEIVGTSSRVTVGLPLQVAAEQSAQPRGPSPVSWPALFALLSLVVSGIGLVAVLASALDRRPVPHRSGSLGSA